MPELPLISIVTPSYNQAEFVEETVRSVLEQEYPHKEYFVIDGGSTDGSVDVIRRYASQLTHWVSEKDRGQSHAINKGFALAKGEVLGWLNSDDTFLRGALATVGACFAENPQVDLVYGDYVHTDTSGNVLMRRRVYSRMRFETLLFHDYLGQPAVFFRRGLLEKVGLVDEGLHYHMDWDLFLRMWKVCRPLHVAVPLATFRLVPTAKTNTQDSERYFEGTLSVQRRHMTDRFASPWLNRLWYRGWYIGSFFVRAVAVLRDGPVLYLNILRDLFPDRRFLRLWKMRLRSPF